jgi:hypothetical protein
MKFIKIMMMYILITQVSSLNVFAKSFSKNYGSSTPVGYYIGIASGVSVPIVNPKVTYHYPFINSYTVNAINDSGYSKNIGPWINFRGGVKFLTTDLGDMALGIYLSFGAFKINYPKESLIVPVKTSSFTLGLIEFLIKNVKESNFYLGARMGLESQKINTKLDVFPSIALGEETGVSFVIGPVFGYELPLERSNFSFSIDTTLLYYTEYDIKQSAYVNNTNVALTQIFGSSLALTMVGGLNYYFH